MTLLLKALNIELKANRSFFIYVLIANIFFVISTFIISSQFFMNTSLYFCLFALNFIFSLFSLFNKESGMDYYLALPVSRLWLSCFFVMRRMLLTVPFICVAILLLIIGTMFQVSTYNYFAIICAAIFVHLIVFIVYEQWIFLGHYLLKRGRSISNLYFVSDNIVFVSLIAISFSILGVIVGPMHLNLLSIKYISLISMSVVLVTVVNKYIKISKSEKFAIWELRTIKYSVAVKLLTIFFLLISFPFIISDSVVKKYTHKIEKNMQQVLDNHLVLDLQPNSIVDKNNESILGMAASRCRYDVVQVLLSRGAEVDSVNDLGETPLILSVKNNCPISPIALLEVGADPFRKDKNGKTAIDYSNSRNFILYAKKIANKTK